MNKLGPPSLRVLSATASRGLPAYISIASPKVRQAALDRLEKGNSLAPEERRRGIHRNPASPSVRSDQSGTSCATTSATPSSGSPVSLTASRARKTARVPSSAQKSPEPLGTFAPDEQRTRATHAQQIDLRLGDASGPFQSGWVRPLAGDHLRESLHFIGEARVRRDGNGEPMSQRVAGGGRLARRRLCPLLRRALARLARAHAESLIRRRPSLGSLETPHLRSGSPHRGVVALPRHGGGLSTAASCCGCFPSP